MISEYRRHVDIYRWRGKLVARSWPTTPRRPPTAGTLLTRTNMRIAMQWFRQQPPIWRSFAARTRPPTHRDWMDLFRRSSLLHTTFHLLTAPACPIAMTVNYDGDPSHSSLKAYCWNPGGLDLSAITMRLDLRDTEDQTFDYTITQFKEEQISPTEQDWKMDLHHALIPSAALWDPVEKTLTVYDTRITTTAALLQFPATPPDPDAINAATYPLAPIYRAADFPPAPIALWPPPPTATIYDYITWLHD